MPTVAWRSGTGKKYSNCEERNLFSKQVTNLSFLSQDRKF